MRGAWGLSPISPTGRIFLDRITLHSFAQRRNSFMDYASLYSDFWSLPERMGSTSFSDAGLLADQIIFACGRVKTLDVGCGEGSLVQALLQKGVDAYGIDPAPPAIERANAQMPGRFQTGSLLSLPFPDSAFPLVVCTDVLEHLCPEDVPQALAELARVSSGQAFFIISTRMDDDSFYHLTIKPRLWWEKACLEAGFRFHARELHLASFTEREMEGDSCTLVLEKIHGKALSSYPLQGLRQERDLHMDMLREAGRRGEAHRQRYHMAAAYIRRGDVVLDVACGLGYGSHILYQNSQAVSITGMDASPWAITYATACYARENIISFQQGDAQNLAIFPDNSIDFVVGFETIEHLAYPQAYLAELFRVLRPGGRLMLSAPNLWVDATGNDPNPYHLHVYSRERLMQEVGAQFQLERSFVQCAGDGRPTGFRRQWSEHDPFGPIPEYAEWILCLAMKSPLHGMGVPYVAREDIPPKNWQYHDFDFAGTMKNPWLYYGMIHKGERLQNKDGVAATRRAVLEKYPPASIDYAAALCGEAYAICENSSSLPPQAVFTLVQSIEQWLSSAGSSPAELRWKVSLYFANGLLNQRCGCLEEAERSFLACTSLDVLMYSPTLGTKTAKALQLAALIALGRADYPTARDRLHRSATEAWRLMAQGGPEVTGSKEQPLWWSLNDMGEVLEIGAQSLKLLFEMDSANTRNGLFSSLISPLWGWNNPFYDMEAKLKGCARRLAGQPVYFWGSGEMYSLRKKIFEQCKPQCVLLDYNPEELTEKDGIPVRHPDEVLPLGEKLPIIIFSWNCRQILQTIENKYFRYTMEDIITCSHW